MHDNSIDNSIPQGLQEIIRGFNFQRCCIFSTAQIDEKDFVCDFAFLKAAESPEDLQRMLRRVFCNIQDQGVCAGSGYSQICTPWVNSVVDSFFSRFNYRINLLEDGTWWVYKNKINISFVIPAYNCIRTIGDSLDSIIRDNFELGDEIIITDDASTDSTYQFIQKNYLSQNPAIKLLRHKHNMGGAAARNTCVKNAINPLIFCLDSDNILISGSVKKLKNFLVENIFDVVSFQKLHYFQSDIHKVTHRWIFQDGETSLQDCLASHIVPPASGNYLYTKASWKAVGGYPEFSKALDAWGFGIRQLAHGFKMSVLKDTGYFHRYGHESYWCRENIAERNSIIAALVLEPYKKLLANDSWSYIHSEAGKNWFGDLEKMPLVVIDSHLRKCGHVENNIDFYSKIKALLRKIRFNPCFFI